MEISKEEKLKILLDRITEQVPMGAGGTHGETVYQTIVSPKKLAGILLELIEK